jgi:hypothetical protein
LPQKCLQLLSGRELVGSGIPCLFQKGQYLLRIGRNKAGSRPEQIRGGPQVEDLGSLPEQERPHPEQCWGSRRKIVERSLNQLHIEGGLRPWQGEDGTG